MHLTDAEKAEIKALIDKGEPLPDKYRFALFKEPHEAELIWSGKTHEVTNVVLPFQWIEQIDEPRAETAATGADLFTLDRATGRQSGGWTNKLIWGDNKLVLSSLKNGPLRREIENAGGLKLVYIDPPFDVGADFSYTIEIAADEFTKQPSVLEDIAYGDTWGSGISSYSHMIYERLRLIADLVAPDASIFVHNGWQVSSVVKVILDEIFGEANFKNELIWKRTSSHNFQSKGFIRATETIWYYTKSAEYFFEQQYGEYSEEQLSRYKAGENGRLYKAENLTFSTRNPSRQFEWRSRDKAAAE